MSEGNLTVRCPHCRKPFEITEALSREAEDKIRSHIQSHLEQEFARKQEEERSRTEKEMKFKDEEIDAIRRRLRQSQDAELELRKKTSQLEEDKQSWELEKQRQMDALKQTIKGDAVKEYIESHKYEDLEKDKKIQDLTKSVEELRQKLTQTSQQLQGEVQELNLELTLKTSYPHDDIVPVEKGMRGADIKQVVRTELGNVCGVILWESKRTKFWSDDWIVKLKTDLRNEKANIPVIVTHALPKEASGGIILKDGVYVISPQLLIPISDLIRQRLKDIARERFLSHHRGTKADQIYEYITSHEFRQQIEALVDVFNDMNHQIIKERTAYEKFWKVREAQVRQMITSTAGMIGSMRGLVGPSFSQFRGLDLPSLDGPDTDSSQ